MTLDTGSGYDTVYLGTIEGNETDGSLDNIEGMLHLLGAGPEAGDVLHINDQTNGAGHTYTVSNAITGSLQLLRAGRSGDVVATLGVGDAIEFNLGHTLGDTTAALAAISGARSGNELTTDVNFDLVYDSTTVSVTVLAEAFATAEELRTHIAQAVDAQLIAGGFYAGDVVVGLDLSEVFEFNLKLHEL